MAAARGKRSNHNNNKKPDVALQARAKGTPYQCQIPVSTYRPYTAIYECSTVLPYAHYKFDAHRLESTPSANGEFVLFLPRHGNIRGTQ